jgi:hypothetical protein
VGTAIRQIGERYKVRMDIRDSMQKYVGWSEEHSHEIRYFGFKSGYVGRYDKSMKRWFWMSGSRVGQMGPAGDVGYAEVLRAEGAR